MKVHILAAAISRSVSLSLNEPQGFFSNVTCTSHLQRRVESGIMFHWPVNSTVDILDHRRLAVDGIWVIFGDFSRSEEIFSWQCREAGLVLRTG